jgi:transposase
VIADDLDTLDAHQLHDALRAARAEAAFKQAVTWMTATGS